MKRSRLILRSLAVPAISRRLTFWAQRVLEGRRHGVHPEAADIPFACLIVFSTIEARGTDSVFQLERGEGRRGVSGCNPALEDSRPCLLRHATSGSRGGHLHAERVDRKCVR